MSEMARKRQQIRILIKSSEIQGIELSYFSGFSEFQALFSTPFQACFKASIGLIFEALYAG